MVRGLGFTGLLLIRAAQEKVVGIHSVYPWPATRRSFSG